MRVDERSGGMVMQPPETKMGHPSKYSHAIVVKIWKAVRERCSREAAAALAGIDATTL